MELRSQKSTFRWLNATQFFGALNDNIFKLLIVFFLIHRFGNESAKTIQGIAGVVFVLPFLLFSHAAGVFADRCSKQRIIVYVKIIELTIMVLGSLCLALRNPSLLYFILFLMAVQSTLFGPSKFGIIPEIVHRERISKANSLLMACTFFAIILGTGGATLLSKRFSGNYGLAGIVCIFFSILGLLCSLRISKTSPKQSQQTLTVFFLIDIWKTLKDVYKDRNLFAAMMGGSYFWMLGAYVQLNIIPFGIEVLDLSPENSNYLFLFTAIGIAIGSGLAGKLSGPNIEFGIVPLGAFGMAVTCILLNFVPVSGGLVYAIVLIILMGGSAGLFTVPLSSFVQYRSPENRRGEILATANFINFIGILIASLLILALSSIFGFTASQGFLVIGIMTLTLLIWSLKALPDFFLRFIAFVIIRCFYRLKIKGIENVPFEGPALLVANHVSWVDALLLTATNQRRIRFLMERKYYAIKGLNFLVRLMGAIPISIDDPPKKLVKALQEARMLLDEGFLVCVFAEGQISRTGDLGEFRKGFEKILKGSDHPLIPIYIGGAWGSVFSYEQGKPLSSLPKKIPYPVTILFGKPMPSTTRSTELKEAIIELSTKDDANNN